MPNIGPKNAPKVSIKDKIPIFLKKVSQKKPTKNPIKIINKPVLFMLRFLGKIAKPAQDYILRKLSKSDVMGG